MYKSRSTNVGNAEKNLLNIIFFYSSSRFPLFEFIPLFPVSRDKNVNYISCRNKLLAEINPVNIDGVFTFRVFCKYKYTNVVYPNLENFIFTLGLL